MHVSYNEYILVMRRLLFCQNLGGRAPTRLRHPWMAFQTSYGSDIAPASRDLEKNLSYVHYEILLIRQDTLRSVSY